MRSELQDIIDAVARQLGVPTSLTDSQFNSLVFGPHTDTEIDQIRRQALLNRQTTPQVREWFESHGTARASEPIRIPADPAVSSKSRVIIPARWGAVTYGFLCLIDDSYQLTDEDIALAVAATPEIARYLLRQHRDRQRGADILHALLSPHPGDRDQAAAELRMSRGILTARVAVLRYPASAEELVVERSIDDALRRASSRSRPVLRIVEPGTAIFLIMGTTSAQALALVNDLVGACAAFTDPSEEKCAGIGDVFSDFTDAAISLNQAELASRAAAEFSSNESHVADWNDLGALRLLLSTPPQRLAETLDPRFATLLGARDATLLPTLEVHLDNAMHAQKTAEQLGIHRGTLYYRLRRAQEISGYDLTNGLDVLALHLAIKAIPFLPDTEPRSPRNPRIH